MAVQGFFSPDKKIRMAGEKENNSAFSVKVEPVKVANNINQYNEQTPSLDYVPDRVGEYIKESEKKQEKKYVQDDGIFADRNEIYRKQAEARGSSFISDDKGLGLDFSYGNTFSPFMDSPSKFDKKDYNVPFSEDEKRVTTAKESYDKLNEYGRTQITDENYKKLQSDYAHYQPLRERRIFRKGVEDNLSDFRSDYMKDFHDADYAIKMKRYNEDGTEHNLNKYILTRDQYKDELSSLRNYNEITAALGEGVNNAMDRYGNLITSEENQKNEQKYAAEEEKRTRLSKEKARSDYEESQKNIFQKIGDTVGNVFNTLTGTLPAQGDTLQAQGINTSATTNIAQMGRVSDSVQAARDAVAKSNLRKSGLHRTVGGASSQANYGRASRGFGTGTHGKGMPSNPGSQRQTGVGVSAGNLSRHKAGPSTSRSGISRSTSRGQGGGSSSRSRGGTGTGRSSQGSKSSARGARGSAGSRSRGGTGSGGTSTSRSASKASRSRTGRSRSQCDIRTKIDVSPLINSNLVKDNLAEVAYFVQEIRN